MSEYKNKLKKTAKRIIESEWDRIVGYDAQFEVVYEVGDDQE